MANVERDFVSALCVTAAATCSIPTDVHTPSASNQLSLRHGVEVFMLTSLYTGVESYVREYMSRYDPSHDYSHLQRVLSQAIHIFATEPAPRFPSRQPDACVVVLAALLHDVGDKKYLQPGESAEKLIEDVLMNNDCPPSLIETVKAIVPNVSYSSEIKQPKLVERLIKELPELAIVQDADRLDAIGAVGIARTFAFGGAKAPDRGLQGCVDHFTDKLETLEAMMKTETGKKMAQERTKRLKEFRGWWKEETELNLGIAGSAALSPAS